MKATGIRYFSAPGVAGEHEVVPILARSVLPGTLAVVFATVGVFSLLATYHVAGDAAYACALSATFTLTSALFSYQVYLVRSQTSVPVGASLADEGGKKNQYREQAQEIACDLFQGAKYVVVTPLVVLRLSLMAKGAAGDILGSTEWQFTFAIIAPLLLLVVRAAVDEFVRGNDTDRIYNAAMMGFGFVGCAAAVAGYVVLMLDIFQAANGTLLHDTIDMYGILLVSYPVIYLIGVLFRVASSDGKYRGTSYPEMSSVLKEVLFAFTDLVGPIFLAFATAVAAFGHPLGRYPVF